MPKEYFICGIRFLHWLRSLRNFEILKLKFFSFLEVEALLDGGNNNSRLQLVSSLGRHNDLGQTSFVRKSRYLK